MRFALAGGGGGAGMVRAAFDDASEPAAPQGCRAALEGAAVELLPGRPGTGWAKAE